MNMKRNTALWLLLVCLATAMVLSGCGETAVEAGEKETPGATTANTEATDPAGTDATDPTTDPSGAGTTDPSVPGDPAEPEKKPNTSGLPGTPGNPNLDMTYEQYMALTGPQQMEHYYTFIREDGTPNGTAFNNWYKAAKEAWDAAQDKEITDGNITLN